jgi:hypothetical protein
MITKVYFIILYIILSIVCTCKSDPSVTLPKKVYRSLESKDPLDLTVYKTAQKIDLKTYLKSMGGTNGNNLSFSKFANIKSAYYETFRTPFFRLKLSDDRKLIEFNYTYADERYAIGKLVEVRCLEFSESYKDCLLKADLEVDYWDEEKRQIILRSHDNILFYLDPIELDEVEDRYFCRANDATKNESEARKRIGSCLKILRDTPGHPPLESLVYDKESVDYFLEAVKN